MMNAKRKRSAATTKWVDRVACALFGGMRREVVWVGDKSATQSDSEMRSAALGIKQGYASSQFKLYKFLLRNVRNLSRFHKQQLQPFG